MLDKIIPDYYYNSIYDVPYTKFYDEGKRLILTDLDNTLISYLENKPSLELITWLNDLQKLGFEVIIVSNSRKDRVKDFAEALNIKFVKFSTKPLKRGLKKGMKIASRKYKVNEVLFLGDQLMTDILGSKRMGFITVLINAIDRKTEYFFTKFNRKLERILLKRCEKKYNKLYNERLKEYVSKNYDSKKV